MGSSARFAIGVLGWALGACSSSSAASHPDAAAGDAGVHADAHVAVDAKEDSAVHARDAAMDASHDAAVDSAVATALCGDCVANKCMPSARDCDNDPTCAMWLTCASACLESAPSPGCFAACDQTYADARSLYEPVYACMCSGCDTLCASVMPCAAGADGGP